MPPPGLPRRTPCDEHLHHRGRCFLPFLFPDPPSRLGSPILPRPFPSPFPAVLEPAPMPPVEPPRTPLGERRLGRYGGGWGAVPLNEFRGVRALVRGSGVGFGGEDVSPRTVPPPQSGQSRMGHADAALRLPTLPAIESVTSTLVFQQASEEAGTYGTADAIDVDRDGDIDMLSPRHIVDSIEDLLYSPPALDREALAIMGVTVPPSHPRRERMFVQPEPEQLPVSIQASFLNDGSSSGGSTPSASSSWADEDHYWADGAAVRAERGDTRMLSPSESPPPVLDARQWQG
ncbi:hypothetical protein LTR53_010181 [Teratosphaeriaceae sp. CCFEE 6253]|nr:hypothetical protein LTR53_010181 [Teratosphaeriaceae sp. CCFEE 6253]